MATWDDAAVRWLIDRRIEFDDALFELRRDGERVPLEPQAFDVLLHLVRNRDRVVAKEELMDSVWGGRFVTEAAVTSRIKQIRRALGDDGQQQRVIRTVHGRGYHFVASVEPPLEPRGDPGSPSTVLDRESLSSGADAPVRYTTSDGLHIAYQVTGGGDLDLVLISGFVSHLDLDWGDPRHAYFLDRLGRVGRLIRFDKRGTGMSDRPAGVPDLETRMHDVLAVMDAVGSERAVLIGYSEGGPMAVLMAATHPERVSALVLYGTYARRTWAEDYPWAQTAEEREAQAERLVSSWDWEADMLMRVPAADRAMQQWWTRRMSAAATPSTVRALYDMNSLVDVRDVLPRVRVPTLVVHRLNDSMFSIDDAHYLADRIPDAQLELLPGDAHFVTGDPAQILDAIEPFLRSRPTSTQHTALAAVVVASVPSVRLEADLRAAGGRVRPTSSGGTAVVFDGPATAARAGLRALATTPAASLGLAIAEVVSETVPVAGAGVDLAAALARAAAPGELLVSSTAASLLSGSGVVLEPLGDRVGAAEDPGSRRAVE